MPKRKVENKLDGYLDISKKEISALRRLSIKKKIEQLEILLKVADRWKSS